MACKPRFIWAQGRQLGASHGTRGPVDCERRMIWFQSSLQRCSKSKPRWAGDSVLWPGLKEVKETQLSELPPPNFAKQRHSCSQAAALSYQNSLLSLAGHSLYRAQALKPSSQAALGSLLVPTELHERGNHSDGDKVQEGDQRPSQRHSQQSQGPHIPITL